MKKSKCDICGKMVDKVANIHVEAQEGYRDYLFHNTATCIPCALHHLALFLYNKDNRTEES